MRGLPLQVKQQPLSDRSSCFRLENSIFVCVPASAFFLCVLFSPFSSVLPLRAVFAFVMWFSPSWFFVRAVLAFVVLPCCVLGPFCVRCLLSFLRLLFPSLWSFLCAALPFLVCCFLVWVLPVCSSLSFVVLPVLAFVVLTWCCSCLFGPSCVCCFRLLAFLGALFSPLWSFFCVLFSPLCSLLGVPLLSFWSFLRALFSLFWACVRLCCFLWCGVFVLLVLPHSLVTRISNPMTASRRNQNSSLCTFLYFLTTLDLSVSCRIS